MRDLKEYSINFLNLKLGKHEFNFDVDAGFFENFEFSLVDEADAQVNVILDKEKETLFRLQFHITGNIYLECDRCLDEFAYPVNLEQDLMIKVSDEEPDDENDEMVIIPPEQHTINIANAIYEFMNLAIPMKPVCEDVGKECNPKMVEILNKMKGDDNDDSDDNDPRWDKLKNLRN